MSTKGSSLRFSVHGSRVIDNGLQSIAHSPLGSVSRPPASVSHPPALVNSSRLIIHSIKSSIFNLKSKIILIIILQSILVDLKSFSQPNPIYPPQLNFVNYEANHIAFPGGKGNFKNLYNKMDQLFFEGKGQINMVQIGGSHIQADMWSAQLRERFQSVAPGVRGGRGFIFPFNIAKSNNPYWYNPEYTGNWESCKIVGRKNDCPIGLAGYTATTQDTATELKVSFRGFAYNGYEFNRIKVLHTIDSNYEVFAHLNSDSTIQITKTIYDSLGYTEFQYNKYVDTLYLEFRKTDSTQTHFTLEGIILETDDPGFFYHAIGVNGAATGSYLREQKFKEHLALLNPDLVTFSIGINDAYAQDFNPGYFEKNYTQLIEWVKEVNPNCAILLTTNNDSYYKRRYPNKNAEMVKEVMQNLAVLNSLAIWDMYEVMGGLGSIRTWELAGLAKKDKIHFTRQGYGAVADLMFSAIMESYGIHVSAKYNQ